MGRFFSGPDSKFEIHTPTAVAAARGSYGIFWVQEVEGKVQTGVLNLKGAWEVRNIDPAIVGSIILKEGEASLVGLGLPPILLPEVKHEIITATEVRDQHKEEPPKKEEVPGRDISTEKFIPISEVIKTSIATTTEEEKTEEPKTDEPKIEEPKMESTIITDITQETTTTTPTIPPIQNQPPPTTSLVHIEVSFK